MSLPLINLTGIKRLLNLSSDDVLSVADNLDKKDFDKIKKILGVDIPKNELNNLIDELKEAAQETVTLNTEALRAFKELEIEKAKDDSKSYKDFTEEQIANDEFYQQYNFTIYRTTGASEIQDGLNDLMGNEDFKSLYPNMKFIAQDDDFTRADHQAWDGVIVRGDDEILGEMATPLHYNCRCLWLPTDEEATHGDELESFPPIPENKF